MTQHPYDTFFDEGLMSRPDPDLKDSINEMHKNTRIL